MARMASGIDREAHRGPGRARRLKSVCDNYPQRIGEFRDVAQGLASRWDDARAASILDRKRPPGVRWSRAGARESAIGVEDYLLIGPTEGRIEVL